MAGATGDLWTILWRHDVDEGATVPRSDLLIDMVDAERRGDRPRFRAVVEAVISDERAKQHHPVADRLTEIVTTSGTSASAGRSGYRGQ